MRGGGCWRVGRRVWIVALALPVVAAAPAAASHPDHLGEGRGQFFSFHTDGARYAVNVAAGNLLVGARDLPLSAADPDERYRRVYNSLDPTTGDHLLGTGWRDNFDVALVSHAANGSMATPDFIDGSGHKWRFERQADGSYRSAVAGFGSLISEGTSPIRWYVRENSTGRTYGFTGASGGLVDEQVDANGTQLVFERNGVAGHESVRVQGIGGAKFYSPMYDIDVFGPLERAYTGQDWHYGHGSNLETVEAPDGRLTRYGYDAEDALNNVQTRTGWTVEVSYVMFSGRRRVSTLRVRKGTTLYTLALSYGPPNPTLCRSTDIAMTTVTDETGRVSRFCTGADWTTTATDGTVVDRWLDGQGTVVNAKLYVDDPSIEPTILAEEWAIPETLTARYVDEDGISTRSPVACTSPSGVCGEYRERSRDSEFDSTASDVFIRYRGTSENDSRVQQAGEIRDAIDSVLGVAPAGSGPIADVLFDWQTRPPGAGSTYVVYEEIVPMDHGTSTDGPGGEVETPGSEDVRVRLVLDSTTRLPIRMTAFLVGNGSLVTRRIWSYGVERLQASELPGDFFRVARPSAPLMEKVVEYQDTPQLAAQMDTDTDRTYTPARLEAVPEIGARDLCFAYAQKIRYREAPWSKEALEMAASSGADPIAYDRHRTLTHYRARRSDGSCPRDGTPDLTIRSTARTSAMATAWRRAYSDFGRAVPLRRGLTGASPLQPVRVDGQDRVVRVLALDATRHGIYVERGETAVVVTGPFAENEVQELVSELKG